MTESSHKIPPIIGLHSFDTSRIRKSIETESRFVVAKGWGKRGTGTANGCGFLFEVTEILTVVTAARICDYIKKH